MSVCTLLNMFGNDFPIFLSILNGQFFMISFFQIVPTIPKLVFVYLTSRLLLVVLGVVCFFWF